MDLIHFFPFAVLALFLCGALAFWLWIISVCVASSFQRAGKWLAERLPKTSRLTVLADRLLIFFMAVFLITTLWAVPGLMSSSVFEAGMIILAFLPLLFIAYTRDSLHALDGGSFLIPLGPWITEKIRKYYFFLLIRDVVVEACTLPPFLALAAVLLATFAWYLHSVLSMYLLLLATGPVTLVMWNYLGLDNGPRWTTPREIRTRRLINYLVVGYAGLEESYRALLASSGGGDDADLRAAMAILTVGFLGLDRLAKSIEEHHSLGLLGPDQ